MIGSRIAQAVAAALLADIRNATHNHDGTPRRFRLAHAAHVTGTLAYAHGRRGDDGNPQLWFTFTPDDRTQAMQTVRLHQVEEVA